ncbi:MAG: TRAP transporter substrate-binding protein DctP [Holophagae bacterium]
MQGALRSLFFGCLAVAAVGPASATQLKVATLAPDGSFWMTEVRRAADEVAERTAGRVEFRFYPGGTMGDDAAVLRKMRIGQLHGGVFLGGSLSDSVPELKIYSLPLLFSDYDQVDAVREAVDPVLIDDLDAEGYHTFGFIEGGFAYLYSTKKAASFDELRGSKAWLPEGDDVGRVLIDEAGLSPVPLGLADVLTGLQTGLIDVVTGPPVGAVALQWFTKVKYIIDVPVIYTFGCMVISNRAWSQLGPADQAVVDEVFGRVTETLDRRARRDNQEALQALIEQGMQVLPPSPEASAEWAAVARRSTERLVRELDLNRELLARINRIAASAASGDPPGAAADR